MSFPICKLVKTACFIGAGTLISTEVHAKTNYDAGNVGISWNLDQFSGQSPKIVRLTNLTFRFNVDHETMHHDGTYFAQQFHFDNTTSKENTGYLGLQPRQDRNGKNYLRAVFSSFISNTKSRDRNCTPGADGGNGVSCGFTFPAIYGHTYEIKVYKTLNNTWNGEVEDQITKKRTHIGSWTLPKNLGNLLPYGEGFAEYYAFYKPPYTQYIVPNCSQLARMNVFYGPVTTTDFGGAAGSINDVHEYNSKECQGNASGFSYQTRNVNITMPNGKVLNTHGQNIIRGFVRNFNNRI